MSRFDVDGMAHSPGGSRGEQADAASADNSQAFTGAQGSPAHTVPGDRGGFDEAGVARVEASGSGTRV